MPAGDYKIVVRPHDGLNLSVCSEAEIADCIRKTLRFPDPTTITDVVQVNRAQNLVLISTLDEGRAKTYSSLSEILLHGKSYKVSPYVTAPDDSAKGILHGIPGYDTQADIMASLQNNTPRVLQARRLGTTNSVIIVFEGPMVPHYVKYRGTLMRCSLYKKKIEVCSICRTIGHRQDICPTPAVKRCQKCGQDNPLQEHEREPKCVVCGGPHMARSKDCDGSNNECHSPLKSQPRTKEDTPRDLAVPRNESDKSRGLLGAAPSPSRRCRPSRGRNPDPGIIR
ncbi:hypothetical protein HPB52_019655 [Rhipicephalus sanguineus]|uniref:Tick transposon n=1 Tax=Rhipicephalus sanguineus TaxID=34632 RepID=A0A9D4TBH3_RHISA|nr:hypothetical protein HPB52_019655 [Rhipicephalus sanguineus]